MRFSLGFICLLASVSALNSGIFTDDGQITAMNPVGGSVEGRAVTNAERMRLGRPLLPPTRRKRAISPCASGAPVNVQGKIQVTASTGEILGFISKVYDGQNSYTFGTIDRALTVSISAASTCNTPVDIKGLNGPDPTYTLLGAVGGSGGYNFKSGSLGYAYLSGTGQTPANSPPSSSAGHSIQSLGYNAPAESRVWYLSPTLDITAQWTNSDGTQPPTSIFYDGTVDFLGLVGDFNKFQATFPGEQAKLVTFRLII